MRLASPALLREVMSRRGYSLADVASVVGCHRSAVSHLRSGRMTSLRTDRAVVLAELLRVPTDLLWLAEEEETPRTLRGRRAAGPAS